MEKAIEIYAAVSMSVIGLSHVTQPLAWADFFIWLRGKGHAGVFVNGFLSLSFGSLIVAFHNVWDGLPVILTLLGWATGERANRGGEETEAQRSRGEGHGGRGE